MLLPPRGGTVAEMLAAFAALGVGQVQSNCLAYPATEERDLALAEVLPHFAE